VASRASSRFFLILAMTATLMLLLVISAGPFEFEFEFEFGPLLSVGVGELLEEGAEELPDSEREGRTT